MDNYDHILMTGYSGFLGRSILERLKVKKLARKIVLIGRTPPLFPAYEWVPLDFMDPQPPILAPGLSPYGGRNLLLHFASLLPNASTQNYRLFERNETEFMNQCSEKQIADIVYASTGGVYGSSKEVLYETHALDAIEPYAIYKRNIERLILTLSPRSSLILRYFFPFGPGQIRPRLFPVLLDKILADEVITFAGDKTGLVYNPVYIDDATEAAVWLIEGGFKGIYNIAGSERLHLKDLVARASVYLGIHPRFVYTREEDKQLIGSIEKVRRLNRNLLQTPLHMSLSRTIAAYTNGAHDA